MRKTIAMTIALLCMVVQGAWAQTTSTYHYSFYTWDSETNTLTKSSTLRTANDLTSATNVQESTFTNDGGWWGVSGDVEHKGRIIVNKDTYLILANNATLTAKQGIFIKEGATLTIYANSEVEGTMGKILAYGEGKDWAAIGGNKNVKAGKLVIHGGDILAEAKHNNAAGIGGGNGDNSGMEAITIYGGKITAKGMSSGAGIGGGQHNNYPGTITIYGGTIDATGGKYAAGIGGGEYRNGWETDIYGGTVTAHGGEYAAGIGGGQEGHGGFRLYFHGGEVYAYGGDCGAGIGGGENKYGGIITIDGGTVEAHGGIGGRFVGEGAGIGGGDNGDGGTVIINGGTVKAYGAKSAYGASSGIGGGCKGGGGNVTINGGDVYAEAGQGYDIGAAGIGVGYGGRNPGKVIINGGKVVSASSSLYAAIGYSFLNPADLQLNNERKVTLDIHELDHDIKSTTLVEKEKRVLYCVEHFTVELEPGVGTDRNKVTIEACDHPEYYYTLSDDKTKHIGHCKYCERTLPAEEHTTGKCTTCGYESGTYTVTLYKAAASGMGYDAGTPYDVIQGQPFELPAIPRGDIETYMMFEGWQQDPATAPTTWEKGSEETGLLEPGGFITPTKNINLYARYDYLYGVKWTWADDYSKATVTLTNLQDNSTVGTFEITNPSSVSEPATASQPGYTKYSASYTYTRPSDNRKYTFSDTKTVPVYYALSLTEEDNSGVIAASAGNKVKATLSGRTLYKDGYWNTICLPFDVEDGDDTDALTFTGTPLEGATVKELSDADFDNGTLTLNFTKATKIKAGVPYLIKWDSGSNLTSPVFTDVIINSRVYDEAYDISDEASITFAGTYKKIDYNAEDRNILFLGTKNTLYFPQPSGGNTLTIGAQRAYFELTGLTAGDVATTRMFFGDGEQTGLVDVDFKSTSHESGISNPLQHTWYSLDGRKLDGKPTARGIYINNGKKVVMK